MKGNPTNKKKVSSISEEFRNSVSNAVAAASNADVATGKTAKGTVNVSNPECIDYPCPCYTNYCFVCLPNVSGACVSFCQSDCETIQYNSCIPESGACLPCDLDTDCVNCCKDAGLPCNEL